MGCIHISATRVGGSVSAKATIETTSISATRVGELPNPMAQIVCIFSNDSYIQVSPDTVWLTPSNGFSADFVVVSNVSWIVE